MNLLKLCITTLLLVATSAILTPARAEEAMESEQSEYVEAGREALGDRMPWYDNEKDEVRAIDVPVAKTPAEFNNRKSRWQSDAAAPGSGGNPNLTWFGSLAEFFWKALTVVFWLLIALVVVGLIYLLIKAYLQREDVAATTSSGASQFDETAEDSERIESLPFTVARPRGDLLDEAMAQYQAGNFRQAVIYLYSYLLIQLDRHQLIHLARGKTNRMYLRELRQQPRLREILERTMFSFEDVFFGNHALTREEFEACLSQLDEFRQQVEQVPA